jgi:Uma2 family endonuclease
MSTQPKTFLTPEEYLEIERKTELKSEYYSGEMFAMTGGTAPHGLIGINLGRELSLQLKQEPCTVYSSDVRVRVLPSGMYTYPDLTVVCGEPQFDDDQRDTLVNPVVLFEVLSDSMRGYDRGQKFEFCRAIASLREYIVVAQHRPHVEHWTRQDETHWLFSEYNDLSQSVHFTSIKCVLALSEAYLKVKFA